MVRLSIAGRPRRLLRRRGRDPPLLDSTPEPARVVYARCTNTCETGPTYISVGARPLFNRPMYALGATSGRAAKAAVSRGQAQCFFSANVRVGFVVEVMIQLNPGHSSGGVSAVLQQGGDVV